MIRLALPSLSLKEVTLKCLEQCLACSRSSVQAHRELSALKKHKNEGFTEPLMTPDEDEMAFIKLAVLSNKRTHVVHPHTHMLTHTYTHAHTVHTHAHACTCMLMGAPAVCDLYPFLKPVFSLTTSSPGLPGEQPF